ncbi:MAG: hypothetical protein PVG07_00015 [Acidobacteriota bacterium]|jgi:hypothetical protein
MSVNTRKQRNYLYGLTFLKWSVEQRLSELERCSIDSTLAIHKFGNKADDDTFKKLCEAFSDYETMIEVAEETFPALRAEMDKIKKAKLTVLKKQGQANKHQEKADQIKEEALNLGKIIEKQETDTKKSKGLRSLFR